MKPMVERERLIGTARGGVKGVDRLLSRVFVRRRRLRLRLPGRRIPSRGFGGVLQGDAYLAGGCMGGGFGTVTPRKSEHPEGHKAEQRGRYDSSSSHPAFFMRS